MFFIREAISCVMEAQTAMRLFEVEDLRVSISLFKTVLNIYVKIC